jgi:hypothetical protein
VATIEQLTKEADEALHASNWETAKRLYSEVLEQAEIPEALEGLARATFFLGDCGYRLVSVNCALLQLAATIVCGSCSRFQPRALCCSSLSRTFDPKVAGSIPARPVTSAKNGVGHPLRTRRYAIKLAGVAG